MKKLIALVLSLMLVLCSMAAVAETTESKGTLIMATNASFPPYEFYEGTEIVGIDVEIAAAVAAKMGYDFTVSDMDFDAIIPAVIGLLHLLRHRRAGGYRPRGLRHHLCG